MRVVGVIPSRWASSRFPGKSLATVAGRPLVQWVVAACRRSRRLDEVLVATDDVRIAQAVRDMGVRAVMTRPDHPSGTDRVAEAADAGPDDIVVNIQGDEPMIDPRLIDRLVEALCDAPDLAMATASAPIRTPAELESRAVVKVVADAAGLALYFSRLPIPCRRDGAPDLDSGLYRRHIGIYAYRGAFLRRFVATRPCALEVCEALEQLRALHLGARIAVVPSDEPGIGVDRPEDVATVEALMRARGMA